MLITINEEDGTIEIISSGADLTMDEVRIARELGEPDKRDMIQCCLDMPEGTDDTGQVPRFGLGG